MSGGIKHKFHGELKNRGYDSVGVDIILYYSIKLEFPYEPFEHLIYDKNGLIQLGSTAS